LYRIYIWTGIKCPNDHSIELAHADRIKALCLRALGACIW